MTIQANVQPGIPQSEAEQVSSYLRRNPEFFEDNPELVADLRLSHDSGNAVSLIEHQIQVLRDKNRELQARLLELVDVARDNDRLNQRMHRLTLAMIDAQSLPQLVDSLSEHLVDEFDADAVRLHLADIDEQRAQESNALVMGSDSALRSMFEQVCTQGKPLCGRMDKEQLSALFPDTTAAIESAAVLPLGNTAERGLLAIGSCENTRFHSAMGTLFLSHLAELFDSLLRQRIPAGSDAPART